MKIIYLDNAATTPVDEDVLAEMIPYFNKAYGNASSLHIFGVEASKAVEKARSQLAIFLGANLEEIVFTSGATESNNLALKGIIKAYRNSINFRERVSKKPHIITTSFEHHCILNTIKTLEKENLIEATFIDPKKDGVISVASIKKEIKPNTILISIMYVNNEIGTLQPIKKIGKMLKKTNKNRTKNKIIFHTDATQAINYFDCNVEKLKVDLLSMSAHKIYGPKGVGALFIKKGIRLAKIQDGGEQERGFRAGTINTPGIVGLGAAISILNNKKLKKINKKILNLRNYLIERILKEIPNSKLNGSKIKRSPNNANFNFLAVEGESLLLMLSNEGIAVSTGSACSSGFLEPSHVLLSLGLKPEDTHGSLRVTLGKYNTKKEIDIFIKKLKSIIEKLRKVSGKVLKDYYKK